jgi:hypothetical protein
MQVRRVVGVVGREFAAAGALLLLFVAYQLWGTGLLAARHKAALRHEFTVELRHVLRPAGATAPGATTTTLPGSDPIPGIAPADAQPIGLIQIPKINLDKVIVEGTSTADLQLGAWVGNDPAVRCEQCPSGSARRSRMRFGSGGMSARLSLRKALQGPKPPLGGQVTATLAVPFATNSLRRL